MFKHHIPYLKPRYTKAFASIEVYVYIILAELIKSLRFSPNGWVVSPLEFRRSELCAKKKRERTPNSFIFCISTQKISVISTKLSTNQKK